MNQQSDALKSAGIRINVSSQSSYCNTVTIPNATAQDASLSWAARGLLLFMLSMPPNWDFHEHDLVNRSPQGRDALRSIVRELEAHGFLERHQARDDQGRQAAAQWRVWDRPQHQRDTMPAPLTGKPSTENPSTDKSPVTTARSPRTEKPSTVEMAPLTGKPSTAEPSTENPSTYKKNNLEIKPIPPLTSLRDVPPHRGERIQPVDPDPVIQASDQTLATSIDQDASPEASSSPRKAPQRAAAATDTTKPSRGPSQGRRAQRSAAAALPDFAEPVRHLLEAWWRLRRKRHKTQAAADPALTPRSINALALAHELGVLQQFAEIAAESGWLSLGFNGHREYLAKLAADLNDAPGHPRSCMLSGQMGRGPALRSTTRQADAAERAIAMFSAPEPPSVGTCSPLPISSTALPA
jgi:hypothetical protein